MTTPLDQTERARFEAKFADVYEFRRYPDTADFDHLAGRYVDALAQAAWEAWQGAIASIAERCPEGFTPYYVQGLDALFDELNRAAEKGYMPDVMEDAWREFDYRPAPPTPQDPPTAADAAKETT